MRACHAARTKVYVKSILSNSGVIGSQYVDCFYIHRVGVLRLVVEANNYVT